MDKAEKKPGYTVRDLLKFIGETGIEMDTKLKIAGKENAFVYTLTFVPDSNVLCFDESRYKVKSEE